MTRILVDRHPLQLEHFPLSELAAGRARSLGYREKLSALYTLLEVLLDIGEADVSHRPPQCIAEDVTLVDDRLAFEVALFRVRYARGSGDDGLEVADVLSPTRGLSMIGPHVRAALHVAPASGRDQPARVGCQMCLREPDGEPASRRA